VNESAVADYDYHAFVSEWHGAKTCWQKCVCHTPTNKTMEPTPFAANPLQGAAHR
jgi:hypothetical protein